MKPKKVKKPRKVKVPRAAFRKLRINRSLNPRARTYTLDELIAYCSERRGRRYRLIASYLEEVKCIHELTFASALLRRDLP